MASTLTDVVTVTRSRTLFRARPDGGSLPLSQMGIVFEPGQRLLVWTARRNRMTGRTMYLVGVPRDTGDVLGEHITHCSPMAWVDETSLEWIERAAVASQS
jgi:hypothetical protein